MVDSRFRKNDGAKTENMMLDIWPYNFSKGDYQKRYDFYLENSDINFDKLTPELRPKMKNFDAIYGKI
jgi:hypothetical protein